jgi:hypothetical protein
MTTSRNAWSSRSGPFHLRRFARRLDRRFPYCTLPHCPLSWFAIRRLSRRRYLKGSDAASEPVQELAANGALAAYV